MLVEIHTYVLDLDPAKEDLLVFWWSPIANQENGNHTALNEKCVIASLKIVSFSNLEVWSYKIETNANIGLVQVKCSNYFFSTIWLKQSLSKPVLYR